MLMSPCLCHHDVSCTCKLQYKSLSLHVAPNLALIIQEDKDGGQLMRGAGVRFSYDAIAPPSDAAARAPGVVQRDCSPVRLHVVRMSYLGCRVPSNSVGGTSASTCIHTYACVMHMYYVRIHETERNFLPMR
jgi:hypothetical protein